MKLGAPRRTDDGGAATRASGLHVFRNCEEAGRAEEATCSFFVAAPDVTPPGLRLINDNHRSDFGNRRQRRQRAVVVQLHFIHDRFVSERALDGATAQVTVVTRVGSAGDVEPDISGRHNYGK